MQGRSWGPPYGAVTVLDIDVFRTEQIPGRNADLWDCIDTVRPLKSAWTPPLKQE